MELLLSNPRQIHALAHPVRVAILDVLRRHGIMMGFGPTSRNFSGGAEYGFEKS